MACENIYSTTEMAKISHNNPFLFILHEHLQSRLHNNYILTCKYDILMSCSCTPYTSHDSSHNAGMHTNGNGILSSTLIYVALFKAMHTPTTTLY